MKRRILYSFFILLMVNLAVLTIPADEAQAQRIQIDRVEPPNWWVGFQETEVELLIYGPNIGDARVTVDYPGIRMVRSVSVENPNYLFVTLDISHDTEPGDIPLNLRRGNRNHTINYPLKARSDDFRGAQGFDSSDVIYLLMPDRFANADPDNDEIPGMLEGVDMDEPYARKGGDIRGIINNLDYIKDLGMTAIWLNPILENDMPYNYEIGAGFYHGYAATDKYRVDRRFGTNEEFLELISKTHDRGMKVIMDKIHNHVGTHHWFIKDMPTSDWVHDQEKYGNTNYRTSVMMDPYASERDYNSLIRAWFVDEMPDLDQRNEFVANYLIQNTIWWIEYSGIDGIRMDTHAYPYKEYMAEWTRRVIEEYPDFNIVGEVWMPNVPTTAWWQYDFPNPTGYNSYLPSVTDFPLYSAIVSGLNEDAGWDHGIIRLYYTLSQDFLYTDPLLNVIFFDNHDLVRFMNSVNHDPDKFGLGVAFLLTTRGIPQIYYGTEIMMDMGDGWSDPHKRIPFPGGWPGDEINAFTHEGRVQLGEERNLPVAEMFDYVRTLTKWRADKEVIHTGSLTHFVPEDNVYVYFRHNDKETVMVVLNSNPDEKTIELERFSEILNYYSSGTDVYTGSDFNVSSGSMTIDARTALILELE